ncbi:DUF1080 domain-containing protein [Phycisphaeraceae bacterium D3-23]
MMQRLRNVLPVPVMLVAIGTLACALGRAPMHAGAQGEDPAEPVEPIEPDEPIELFDGESLDGWAGDTALFEAEDGVLRCTGEGRGILKTEQSYTGYILTLEWRWPADDNARVTTGDAGVFLHVGPGQGVNIWPQCIEVQLEHGNAGDFWLVGVALTPFDADQPQTSGRVMRDPAAQENEAGQWNTLSVLCDGGYIEVQINGEPANAGFDAARTQGPIALQSEGDAIEYRNIQLAPLE